MSADDDAKPIPMSEFAVLFERQQRAHCVDLLAVCMRQIEVLQVDDVTKQRLVGEARALLVARMERSVREVRVLCSRDPRPDDQPLH